MLGSSQMTNPPSFMLFERTTIMFKKLTLGALLLAVAGSFAAISVDAQRLVVRKVTKTTDIVSKSGDPVVEAVEPEANTSIDIRQCENGGINDLPAVQNCGFTEAGVSSSVNWVSGNVNGQKAHYAEGRNIHYRAVFGSLVPGDSYEVRLGYDTFHNNILIHTIDYLNTYDAAIATGYKVNPCGGVTTAGHPCAAVVPAGTVPPSTSTFAIPDDSSHPFDPAGRVFTAWGATITNIQFDPATVGTAINARTIIINFTANVANPVMGWSGHIASGAEWGPVDGGVGAGGQQGSPYHMRVVGNGTFQGNQELQLSADAIQAPSAAGAEVSGRVTDLFGRGISGAQLVLFNAVTGDPVVVYTNTFGYYTFSDVPVGEFYVMSVSHRRHVFVNGSVSFSLEDNLAGLDFQASR